jgi:hypothetical protein
VKQGFKEKFEIASPPPISSADGLAMTPGKNIEKGENICQ